MITWIRNSLRSQILHKYFKNAHNLNIVGMIEANYKFIYQAMLIGLYNNMNKQAIK